MKKTQHIKVSKSAYALLQQEVERLRAEAAHAEELRIKAEVKAAQLDELRCTAEIRAIQLDELHRNAEAKAAQLTAEKAALAQALQEERDRFRKVIKEFVNRRSERYKAPVISEEQLSLFADQMVALAQTSGQEAEATPSKKKAVQARRPHPGRRPVPQDIPRIDVTLEPEEDTTGYVRIGEEVTEELDYLPGHFFVRRFIRPKYARPDQAGIAIAPAPVRVIDKGIPGPMLLSHILVSKYADHLPLYRQLTMFKRSGIDINDVTLNGWVTQVLELLKVIYHRIRDEMLSSRYLMADESTIRVLDRDKEGSTHLGYYWVYRDPVRRSASFIYEKGRAGKYVREHLQTFSGYLQTDAYAAYDAMPRVNLAIIMVGCWAHVRRKFVDAQAGEKVEADWFLGQIQRLYAIERFCRIAGLTHEERLQVREHAIPILEAIKARMVALSGRLTPKNVLQTAIQYTLKQWEELTVYTRDGMLEIDNNLVENSIRVLALGRKNYLFAGSHDAAQRSAVIYSILASCKANDINPLAYLADLLDKLPTRTVNNIEDLLPHNWKPEGSFFDLGKM